MRWVTYHWHIANGVTHVNVHDDKDSAAKFFKKNFGRFFQIRGNFKVSPPCSYGYSHRKYIVCSLLSFKRQYGFDPVSGRKVVSVKSTKAKTGRKAK